MSDPIITEMTLSTDDVRARKRRNLWLALALLGFVILVGVVTAVRVQESFSDPCARMYLSGNMSDAQEDARCREQTAPVKETRDAEQ